MLKSACLLQCLKCCHSRTGIDTAEASICALRIARPNCSLLTTVDWHLRGSRQTYGVIPISAGQGRRTYKLDCGYWDRNVSITKLLYNPGGKSVMVEDVLSWRKTKILHSLSTHTCHFWQGVNKVRLPKAVSICHGADSIQTKT
jgi:hypothetical protein